MFKNSFIFTLTASLLALARPVHAGEDEVFCQFTRGDVSGDRQVNLGDVLGFLSTYFTSEGQFDCEKAADVDDDGRLSLTDAMHTLTFLFARGAPPAPPYPDCGVDPTADNLTCPGAETPQGEAQRFHLFNNGILCFAEPCFSWQAELQGSNHIAISHLDLSALDLEEEQLHVLVQELAQGLWTVSATTADGPEGPAGVGRTLIILELLERNG